MPKSRVTGENRFRALLVSAPWQYQLMPCLGICALSAYGRQHGFAVDTLHACRRFHTELSRFAEDELRPSEGEAIGASLLFPELQTRILRNMRRRFSGVTRLRSLMLDVYRGIFESVPWDEYNLVGFSIVHGKMYLSLLMAKWLKELRGNIVHITVGGSRVIGNPGLTILQKFPQIDSIISGEGELALVGLLNKLSGHQGVDLSTIPGISYRQGKQLISNPNNQISNLDELPVPWFEEYETSVRGVILKSELAPSLNIEASRGCYNRCAFCTDVLGWKGYRIKSPEKLIREILYLTQHYKVKDYFFVDRVTPHHEWWGRFSRLLSGSPILHGISIHAEVRPTISRQHFIHMKRSNVVEMQFGCETLSSGVLESMRKNSRVIDNLHALKLAEEFQIRTSNNFMIQFPTEQQNDVNECADNIFSATPYQPFQMPHKFVLEFGSIVFCKPRLFGIFDIAPKDMYCDYPALPAFLLKRYGTVTYAYKKKRYVDYRRLMAAYTAWWNDYHRWRKKGKLLLAYRNLGRRGIVTDRRNRTKTIHLNYLQNRLVQFCEDIRTWKTICERFNSYSEIDLRKEIEWLCQKHILFCDNTCYLSLPVNPSSNSIS